MASLTWHCVFKIHPCYAIHVNVLYFKLLTMLHCVIHHILVIYSPFDGPPVVPTFLADTHKAVPPISASHRADSGSHCPPGPVPGREVLGPRASHSGGGGLHGRSHYQLRSPLTVGGQPACFQKWLWTPSVTPLGMEGCWCPAQHCAPVGPQGAWRTVAT